MYSSSLRNKYQFRLSWIGNYVTSSVTLTGSIGFPSILRHCMLSSLGFTTFNLVILFVLVMDESSACRLYART